MWMTSYYYMYELVIYLILYLLLCIHLDKEINSISLDGFKYVYYTEADQLVYIRSQGQIMDALDRQQKSLILTPHRMHTILLPSVYPHLDKYLTPPHRKVNLANVKVITESPLEARGSCCDSGRFNFPSCGNFWYLCPKWGLNNYTDWVRYGAEGFVMPMGTVHQAKCSYSPYRKMCPLPRDCERRFPTDQTLDASNYKPPKASAIDTPGTPLREYKHVFWDEATGRPYRYLPVCRERVAATGD